MPFGDPAYDALEEALAHREKAEKAAKRMALRERTARSLPPGSRDDLAIVILALEAMKLELMTELAEVRQAYMQKLKKV